MSVHYMTLHYSTLCYFVAFLQMIIYHIVFSYLELRHIINATVVALLWPSRIPSQVKIKCYVRVRSMVLCSICNTAYHTILAHVHIFSDFWLVLYCTSC